MQIIKYVGLAVLFLLVSYLGHLFSKKYAQRVDELKEVKNALNTFKTKMKFTYEPIPELFQQLSTSLKQPIAQIFEIASCQMKQEATAGNAWSYAIENVNTNLTKEDLNILKNLNKLLGKTDLEGQLSEIELTSTFLDTQMEKAEQERNKNEKLYKTLGTVLGLAIVVILA